MNTVENFLFAGFLLWKNKVAENEGVLINVTMITSDFHVARTRFIADAVWEKIRSIVSAKNKCRFSAIQVIGDGSSSKNGVKVDSPEDEILW